MMPPIAEPVEFDMQKALLFTKVGLPGSGAARYGAAMYFYNQKKMTAEMLEIYRRCCKFDMEDPIDLARFESIATIPDQSLKP